MTRATVGRLVRQTYAKWNADDGWLFAAAMAAFAALALAPLLVISLRVAEAFGGRPTVVHGLALAIVPLVGHGAVRSLEAVADNARAASNGTLMTALSVLIALFAGSRLFYALQRALHVMWNTPQRRSTSLAATAASFVVAGALSVCVIAAMSALIFGSGAFSQIVHAAGARGILAAGGVRTGVALMSGAMLAPVVAGLFKWLPGIQLAWSDVWIGALTTTLGFVLSQFAIAFYLAAVNLPWTYGSAASLVVVLLWLYYSSYLFLLGAEFTLVYAREAGSLREGPNGDRPAEQTGAARTAPPV